MRQSDESRVNISAVLIGRLSSREMRRRVKTVSSALVVAFIALIQGKTQTDTKRQRIHPESKCIYISSRLVLVSISLVVLLSLSLILLSLFWRPPEERGRRGVGDREVGPPADPSAASAARHGSGPTRATDDDGGDIFD